MELLGEDPIKFCSLCLCSMFLRDRCPLFHFDFGSGFRTNVQFLGEWIWRRQREQNLTGSCITAVPVSWWGIESAVDRWRPAQFERVGIERERYHRRWGQWLFEREREREREWRQIDWEMIIGGECEVMLIERGVVSDPMVVIVVELQYICIWIRLITIVNIVWCVEVWLCTIRLLRLETCTPNWSEVSEFTWIRNVPFLSFFC